VAETTFDTTTPTPCTYPGCTRILKGNAGLGGHLAWHNRQEGKLPKTSKRAKRPNEVDYGGKPTVVLRQDDSRPKRKYARKPKPVVTPVETMSAVTICFTVLSAMFPTGALPVNKLPIVQRWAQETERFVEDMYGDH